MLRAALAFACLALLLAGSAAAQEPAPALVEPDSVPVSEISARADLEAEALTTLLDEVSRLADISALETSAIIARNEVVERGRELASQLERASSFDTLSRLQREWLDRDVRIEEWQKDLGERAQGIQAQLTQLDARRKLWSTTRTRANEVKAPEVVVQAATAMRNGLDDARREVTAQRDGVLELLADLRDARDDVQDALREIASKQQELLTNLLVRDQPPIWASTGSEAGVQAQLAELDTELTRALRLPKERPLRFALHLFLLAVALGGLHTARRRARTWSGDDARLARVARILEHPHAIALIAFLAVVPFLYGEPPYLIRELADLLILFPTLIVLRPLISAQLQPALRILAAFYLFDQLRDFVDRFVLVTRWLFIAEMLLASAAAAWLLSRSVREPLVAERATAQRTEKIALQAAIGVFALAALCASLGFVRLSRWLGDGVLGTAYLGILAYAVLHIARALLAYGLRSRPVRPLRSVSSRASMLETRLTTVLRLGVAFAWIVISLQLFGLNDYFAGVIRGIFDARIDVGSLGFSLNDLLAFTLTITAAVLLARAIQAVLDDDVYPRLGTPRGVSYAISTVLRYAVIAIGFFAALAALGFDTNRLTVLVGAFGVGIGFGLQNVVNNFVSGLILLFERPIQLEDEVDVQGISGHVHRIGIRASVVRTFDGAEVTIPNGTLLSEKITNWTRSDRHRRMEVGLTVARVVEPSVVHEALRAAASQIPELLAYPPPQSLFIGYGPDSLEFMLRAWVGDTDHWMQARGALVSAIQAQLDAHGVLISKSTTPTRTL